jgi:glycosyltransferase involved in cell wall biosynthesis
MGENGRRYVADNYRWDVVLARYRELIEAAAAG